MKKEFILEVSTMKKCGLVFILLGCGLVYMTLIVSMLHQPPPVQAQSALQTTPPPPFLGPIYYGRWDVLKVFDHEFPLAGLVDDGNTFVLHHDGIKHLPNTPIPTNTPTGTPLTPTPGTPPPTSTPGNIPGGYGYDQHGGIDYDLEYVPVLAAADGTVTVAGWNNPANHRFGYGLYVTINHGDYRTIYGHLSALTVQVGDEVSPSPEKSVGIIGISGNTGGVLGGCGDVEAGVPLICILKYVYPI